VSTRIPTDEGRDDAAPRARRGGVWKPLAGAAFETETVLQLRDAEAALMPLALQYTKRYHAACDVMHRSARVGPLHIRITSSICVRPYEGVPRCNTGLILAAGRAGGLPSSES
jgi:hypothetical protein